MCVVHELTLQYVNIKLRKLANGWGFAKLRKRENICNYSMRRYQFWIKTSAAFNISSSTSIIWCASVVFRFRTTLFVVKDLVLYISDLFVVRLSALCHMLLTLVSSLSLCHMLLALVSSLSFDFLCRVRCLIPLQIQPNNGKC